MAGPVVQEHLDLSRPVAVLLVSVLHFLTEADDPAGVVRTFRHAPAPGSYLAVSHVTPGGARVHVGMPRAVREYTDKVGPIVPRPAERVRELLAGWGQVRPPGVVNVQSRAASRAGRVNVPAPMVGGLARRRSDG